MSGGGGLFEEEHAPHENHERYLLTYADMITLLLALFIVLWAISTVDQAKFAEFQAGLSAEFGAPAIEGGDGLLPGHESVSDAVVQTEGVGSAASTTTTVPLGSAGLPGLDGIGGGIDNSLITDPTGTDVHLGGGDGVVGFEEATTTELALEGLLARAGITPDEAAISVDSRGVVVTLNPDFGFPSGSYDLQPGAIDVLDELFGPLSEVTNELQINGHTDDTPYNGEFGNIQLSGLRAAAVYSHLVRSERIAPARAGIGGYGETQPVADNDSAEGRAANRRIEIVLLVEPGATPPTAVPGTAPPATTATTAPVRGEGATTTTATGGAGTGTNTTTTTGSGTHTEATTVATVDHITQGVVVLPGRD